MVFNTANTLTNFTNNFDVYTKVSIRRISISVSAILFNFGIGDTFLADIGIGNTFQSIVNNPAWDITPATMRCFH
jgi:hypothetical protein